MFLYLYWIEHYRKPIKESIIFTSRRRWANSEVISLLLSISKYNVLQCFLNNSSTLVVRDLRFSPLERAKRGTWIYIKINEPIHKSTRYLRFSIWLKTAVKCTYSWYFMSKDSWFKRLIYSRRCLCIKWTQQDKMLRLTCLKEKDSLR
jgi:hypothetical protein